MDVHDRKAFDAAAEPAAIPPRLRRACLLFLGIAAVGVIAHAAHAVVAADPGQGSAVADWFYCALFAAAAASCALRARRERREGGNARAWTIAAVGVSLWGSAEVSFRLLESDPAASYPQATQGILLLAFALATITLLLLGRDRIDGFHRGLALDGLVGGLAVAAVAASLLFPVGDGHLGVEQPGPPTVFLLADLAILACVVVTIALTGWRPGWCWGLMCAGILVNTVGNIALVQTSAVGSFHRGSLVDTLYIVSALLLGLAAWFSIRPAVKRRSDDVRRVAAPLAFALLALSLLFLAGFVRISPVAILLATTTLALIVVRTALAFRDNRGLLEARERDALTDGLTGIGNRRKLMQDLDEAVAAALRGDQEWTLMLFDLDGFKSYNDSFGHSAGDALLTRLGANLQAAVEAHGAAYRMGGDEFCVLVRTADLKTEAILAGASEALSDSGSGFTIRPSFGTVALRHEADTSAQALQLADQRMYRQKHGRPGPVTQEARAVLLRVLKETEPGLDDHQHAVARLSREVGRELDLDNEELDVLTRAAEFHDIGKMATPDAILHKPGPLTEQEWEIMRRHSVIGERILNSVPALRPVATIVRSTHERIDGSGYPDALPGGRIPLASRIIAVCDAYNAMTTERPYDRPMSHDEALEELRRCAGAQFDSEIVEAFCRINSDGGLGNGAVPVHRVQRDLRRLRTS